MSSQPTRPDEIALQQHRDYYSAGTYDDDRLRWTVETFLPDCRGKRVLEIGCGDGKLLALLREKDNEVQGIEASATGVEKCAEKEIAARCMDVSSQPLPFPDDHFDVVVSLETIEHLMNPYYALLQVRRVLKENAVFICSVPNPATGHPYLYPGLFSFPNFSQFLTQLGWRIEQVNPWQWAPRESILPVRLRGLPLLSSRYVAGTLRRVVEKLWLMTGHFPWFCYWLWTFKCVNAGKNSPTILEKQIQATKPGGRPA